MPFQKGNKINLGRIPWNKGKGKWSGKRKEYQKKWREKNKEKMKKYHYEYWRKNHLRIKERKQESDRQYYINHKEEFIERHKEWILKNPEKRAINRKRGKAKRKGAIGFHTLKEWEDLKKKYGYMCLCCKREEPEIILTEDHIIPLSKGGTDFIDNIQSLCGECNSIKFIKIIDFRQVFSIWAKTSHASQ